MDHRTREARRLQNALGEALFRYWDPLMVGDEPELKDEYNAYVASVYRLLASGATDEELAQHLKNLEANELGFPDTKVESLLPVAHKLRNVFNDQRPDAPAT